MDDTRRLWTLLLLPPIVWAVHLDAAYALHAQACESNSRVILWILSLVLFAIVAFTAFRAYGTWRSYPDSEDNKAFLAAAAFGGACFFALVIVGQTIPMLMLRPCD